MTRTTAPSLERLVDSAEDLAERAAAAARLGLIDGTFYRVVALPASEHVSGSNAVVSTPAGLVRFAVFGLTEPLPTVRAGIGLACQPNALDRSWRSALLALRLTSRSSPVIEADALGSMLLIAEATDAAPRDQTDLTALKFFLRSQPRELALLEALATMTAKSAATATGLHVDTVHTRAREVQRALGFDVLTSRGRARLAMALALFRLHTNRFE